MVYSPMHGRYVERWYIHPIIAIVSVITTAVGIFPFLNWLFN